MWETTFVGIPASVSHQLHVATKVGAVRLLALVAATACCILAIGPDRLSAWKARLEQAKGATRPTPRDTGSPPKKAPYRHAPARPLALAIRQLDNAPGDLVERLREQYHIGYEMATDLGAAARSLRDLRGQPPLPKIDVWENQVETLLVDWPNHRAHFLMDLPMDQRLPSIGVLFANTGDELPRKPYLEFRLDRLNDVIGELEQPSTP